MVFGSASSITFISLAILSFATEIHLQEGCIDVTVGSGATDTVCACLPQDGFSLLPQCSHKSYATGWLTTKITIFDPPCEEVFQFPTRYAQVFYTVDGCLRDGSHKPIKCCQQRPYQFPDTCPDMGDGHTISGCRRSTAHVSLADPAPLENPVPFSNELLSDGEVASNDFKAQDENTGFLSDTMTESMDLGSPVAKRNIMAKAYRSKGKRHFLDDEAVESRLFGLASL